MGDPAAPPVQESMGSVVNSLTQNLPALMKAYSSQVGPTDQALLASSQATSPAYAALMDKLYQTFAPSLAKTGADIDASNRTASANVDAQLLKGPGQDIALTSQNIDKQLNPEYYKTRENESNSLAQLLRSTNLDKPNIEAERQINQENARSGNLNTPSETNTVSNALSFGSANRERQQALSQAINTATNFLQPSSNPAPMNAAQSVLAKPPSSTGLSNFNGVTQAGQQSFAAGNNLLQSGTSLQNNAMDINANRRDVLDRVNSTVGVLQNAPT